MGPLTRPLTNPEGYTLYTIYSQAGFNCPHCVRAATMLDVRNIAYSLRPLAREELLQIAEKAGMRTVPIIYKGDTLIGGADDLAKHLEAEVKQ